MGLNELSAIQEKTREARYWVRQADQGSPRYEAAKEYLDQRFGLPPEVAQVLGAVTAKVQQAAEAHGVYLDPQQAADLALAALHHSDDQVVVSEPVSGVLWDNEEDARRAIRANLQRHLAVEVATRGFIPVALPAETITRKEFGLVVVTLSVPVRRPV